MPPAAYRPCAFCHKMFGSASLAIHESRCRERPAFVPQAALAQRRPPSLPSTPGSRPEPGHALPAPLAPSRNGSDGPLRLLPCRLCGRTFFAERLAVHEQVCIATPLKQDSGSPSPTSVMQSAVWTPSRRMKTWHYSWRQKHADFQRVTRSRGQRDALPPQSPPRQQSPTRLSSPQSPPPRSPNRPSPVLALHRQADGARTARTYCTGGAAVAPERPGSASAAAATSASSGSLAARDRRARARLVQFNAAGLRSCEAARESDPLAPPVERRRSPAQRHAALWAQQPAPLAGPEATLGLGELGGLFMAGP